MPRINLLPWRAELRQRRKKEFLVALGGSLIVAVGVVYLSKLTVQGWTSDQQARNAVLKQEMARRVPLDPAALPYETRLVDYLRGERAKGRRIILATATDRRVAEAVAPLPAAWLRVECRQTNHEGVLIDWLHEAWVAGARAVLLNAGGYTHTSIAIHDAIRSIKVPVIEVHLSDPMKREEFRHLSYVGMAAVAHFAGHGANSYTLALDAAARL